MKLSEMTIKESKIKILKLLPITKSIAKDKELTGLLFRKIQIEKGMTELEIKEVKYNYNIDKAFDIIELFLEKYEDKLFNILAIMNDTSAEYIENWTLSRLSEAVAELLEDEGFSRLFTLAVK